MVTNSKRLLAYCILNSRDKKEHTIERETEREQKKKGEREKERKTEREKERKKKRERKKKEKIRPFTFLPSVLVDKEHPSSPRRFQL